MAKIPKNLPDKDMLQGQEEEIRAELLREGRQAEYARTQAEKEPPADLAHAGLTAAQSQELGRALLELKLTLAQSGIRDYKLKIERKGHQVLVTAT